MVDLPILSFHLPGLGLEVIPIDSISIDFRGVYRWRLTLLRRRLDPSLWTHRLPTRSLKLRRMSEEVWGSEVLHLTVDL